MGGKSSLSGARVASRARSDFGGAGSIISRVPSFRMMASSPGNSNSRGIRTAWFRPFLKTLTCRCAIFAAPFGICLSIWHRHRECQGPPAIRLPAFLDRGLRVEAQSRQCSGEGCHCTKVGGAAVLEITRLQQPSAVDSHAG